MNRMKHSHQGTDTTYHYLTFDSTRAFDGFVDQEMEHLDHYHADVWQTTKQGGEVMLEQQPDWYGTPSPTRLAELEEHQVFSGMELLKEIQPLIREHLSNYLHHIDAKVLPKPVIAYNDRGVGIFSFDRAAMGLYKLPPVNLRTRIDKTITQLRIALNKKEVATSVKNVYAWFEHKPVSYPSMRLYILAGGNAHITGDALLYVGLACSELVEFLEQRNVAVEVNVLIGSSFDGRTSLSVVRAKRFEDTLDKNQLLLLSSDPRYFRYRGFKSLIAMSNYFGFTIPKTLGSMTRDMGNDFVTTLDNGGFVFEQSYSLESAVGEVARIMDTYCKQLNKNQ